MALVINTNTVISSGLALKVSSGATDPASPSVGMIFFNTTQGVLKVYDGTQWVLRTTGGATNVLAWGRNDYLGSVGYLGISPYVASTFSPTNVVGGYTDFIDIASGQEVGVFTAGIRATQGIWSWGSNSFGELGDNTINFASSPVSVVGGITDWISISGGSFHVVALRGNRNGSSAFTWGRNSEGQLGDGTLTHRSSPVSVAGGITDWIKVVAGSYHCLGIRSNGTMLAWGNGNILGDGTSSTRSSPVSVLGGYTDWVEAGAGTVASYGIRANGTLWAWGNNGDGQLGDGTSGLSASKLSPVSVLGGFTDWIKVAGGKQHALGIRANGTMWSWGNGGFGALGSATTLASSPISVLGGFTDWVDATCGYRHSFGVRANGTAWAWGLDNQGILGQNGANFSISSPQIIIGGITDWIKIAAGYTHTVGIRA